VRGENEVLTVLSQDITGGPTQLDCQKRRRKQNGQPILGENYTVATQGKKEIEGQGPLALRSGMKGQGRKTKKLLIKRGRIYHSRDKWAWKGQVSRQV